MLKTASSPEYYILKIFKQKSPYFFACFSLYSAIIL